ncbi:Orn/Lys/Arg decarboxylase N-terminal domain-containing protein [Streptomyces sp. TRM76323]|uniref:Orn/Lys/Arg decarboxylase N-terminal domain-containing protein n=1 Tax=Streptomyces tamarix TaxID=3078565 RepID=A0ABU3QRL5_9ACTN|nr:Orn/Lys/Arg decarboxylase N-terminal domain-containing protein [Streptomyces tamarix]MDT9685415.1 Orn/Lys/Arg decarboxylase N-terminal domain-containing protein [Streptomyces tamarix]
MASGTVLLALREIPSGGGVGTEQLRRIGKELEEQGLEPRWAASTEDVRATLHTEAGLAAAVVAWDLPGAAGDGQGGAEVLRQLQRRYKRLPVFLLMEDGSERDLEHLPLWVSEAVVGYIWPLEDTAPFIAGRVVAAAHTYHQNLLPPFFKALRRFDDAHEYSWHTPAHSGGVAFLKSAPGRAFFEYFGERLFRSDLSISVGALGSLFEHNGPIGDAERNAARVFGSDRTYFVLHGDSTADRMVGHYSVTSDEIALVDRNCHKSVLHGLVLSGARPVYLVPTRNGYGLAGPLPPNEIAADAVAARVAANPLAAGAASRQAQYAVLTNSTYDGLCYDTIATAHALAPSTPRLHFDEAWFAYARFHPLYAGRFGMAVGPDTFAGADRPTVFSTQSTHKLLAALSQTAMVHVKSSPRAPVEHERFNEAFMMHGTTSPLYPAIASLDVATAMMDGPQGQWLIDEAVTEAVRFRQAVVRTGRRIADAGDRPGWFFGVWQPDAVTDPATGERVPFADAPTELLRGEPACWLLEPGADWHGFRDLSEGYCMLDPIKVTLTCPGVTATGETSPWGIPARVLTSYLADRGIVVEKTDSYTTLVLFSMGITKGKWGTLMDALMDFKALYDTDAPLEEVLPALVEQFPLRYGGTTLRGLCQEMHEHLTHAELIGALDTAFQRLPEPVEPPQRCYQRLIRGGTERLRLGEAAGRVAAAMVTVTPPGIPVLMPGESVGAPDGPLLRYLRALEAFDRAFPGFHSEAHGVTMDPENGDYLIECVRLPQG